MEKKRLDLDDVKVEAFEIEGERAGRRGTVYGLMPTFDATCTCDPDATCDPFSGFQYSCNVTWCPGSQCVIYCRTDEPSCSP